ncbi:transglycosylase SLT domain-containing protein [Frigidibacter sp.]|uniref:transglycosylase SLT domain-containing protein n=1 Tax=Frigidibacter sp. TaxID=2586418 RepID=UPI0027373730|nr:transglycosylase SLT domain-containing protein [Frigidibacter sp.]MDP3341077.1 transglycosylase SLT domain-containing protein [Frigidibacter sp.]
MQPVEAPATAPVTRWDHRPEALSWTEATLTALETDGAVLATTVPTDIATFCPGYATASLEEREAFWVGMLSALAKHESTWNPKASGGGGQWLGLMQIAPGTARAYNCEATSASALKDGSANLACAVKIAARQVGKDRAILSNGRGGWAGLARDWAPMRSSGKVAEMASWTKAQPYCRVPSSRT